MVNNRKLAFIGPISPPVGGVSVMNENIQKLLMADYEIERYSTASSRRHSWLLLIFDKLTIYVKGFKFILTSKAKVINIFVTSGGAFVREASYILMSILLGKKVVIHLHSKSSGEFFLRKYLINLFGFVLNFSDVVIVLSEKHKDFFSKYINNNKLQVLENFVFEKQALDQEKRSYNNFMYIGRLTKIKGFYDLVDAVKYALKDIPNICIHAAGDGLQAGEYNELLRHIETLGLKENFYFYGEVVGDNKDNIFSICPVLIFPSHFENSPVVLKEALAAKQIVICSDIGANVMTLNSSCPDAVFYYPVGDSIALSKLIVLVYGEQENLRKISCNIQCPKKSTSDYALGMLHKVYSRLL